MTINKNLDFRPVFSYIRDKNPVLVRGRDFYDRKAYIFIALAPVILWGIILAVINPFVPAQWFWVVYLIQITNLSGAAGDLFVTVRFSRLPDDILIRDYGVGMTVFTKKLDKECFLKY